MMNQQQLSQYINQLWDESITPTLMEYIKIPNKSPQFDPNWRTHGYMDSAVILISNWCQTHAVENMTLDVIQLEDRTPVIFIDIPGKKKSNLSVYFSSEG